MDTLAFHLCLVLLVMLLGYLLRIPLVAAEERDLTLTLTPNP